MGVLDIQPSAHSMRTLATSFYCPGSDVQYSTTSATLADVDATNAAVTFTVPTSGTAWITAAFMVIVGVNTPMDVGLRDGSSDVANTKSRTAYAGGGTATMQGRVFLEWKLTGLTPGASKTIKLSYARASGADTCHIHAGTLGGPLTMTAQERP